MCRARRKVGYVEDYLITRHFLRYSEVEPLETPTKLEHFFVKVTDSTRIFRYPIALSEYVKYKGKKFKVNSQSESYYLHTKSVDDGCNGCTGPYIINNNNEILGNGPMICTTVYCYKIKPAAWKKAELEGNPQKKLPKS